MKATLTGLNSETMKRDPLDFDASDYSGMQSAPKSGSEDAALRPGKLGGSEADAGAGATKPTNPKDAVGTLKVPISVIPFNVLGEVGNALLEGACKYGRHNYRAVGVRASVYIDAVVMRHIGNFWEGQDIDPDSGIHELSKAIAGLIVLRDCIMRANWVDDRPPASPSGWLAEQNKKAKEIVEKYPDPEGPICGNLAVEKMLKKGTKR